MVVLVSQSVFEKENSEFKLAFFRLNSELVSQLRVAEGLGKYVINTLALKRLILQLSMKLIDWFQRHVNPSRVILSLSVGEYRSVYIHI